MVNDQLYVHDQLNIITFLVPLTTQKIKIPPPLLHIDHREKLKDFFLTNNNNNNNNHDDDDDNNNNNIITSSSSVVAPPPLLLDRKLLAVFYVSPVVVVHVVVVATAVWCCRPLKKKCYSSRPHRGCVPGNPLVLRSRPIAPLPVFVFSCIPPTYCFL